MNHKSWVRQEIEAWMEENIISPEVGETLLARYKGRRVSLYTGEVALLAVAALLMGVFFILAGMWHQLTQDERFVAVLVPVIFSGLLLSLLLWDRRHKVSSESGRTAYRIPLAFREGLAIFHGLMLLGAFWLVNDTFLLSPDWLLILSFEAVCLLVLAYLTESAGMGILSMAPPVYMYHVLPHEAGTSWAVWGLLVLALPLLIRLLGVYRHKAVVAYSWVWTIAVLSIFGSASNLLWQTLFFSLAASLTWLSGDALRAWGPAAEVLRLVGGAALFGVLLEASWGPVWADMVGHWFLWLLFFLILAINGVLLLFMGQEKKWLDVVAGATPFAMLIAATLAVFETTGVASALFISSFAVFFALAFIVAGYAKDRALWKILGVLLLLLEAALRVFDSSLSYGERGLFFCVVALLLVVLSGFSFFIGKRRRRRPVSSQDTTISTPIESVPEEKESPSEVSPQKEVEL